MDSTTLRNQNDGSSSPKRIMSLSRSLPMSSSFHFGSSRSTNATLSPPSVSRTPSSYIQGPNSSSTSQSTSSIVNQISDSSHRKNKQQGILLTGSRSFSFSATRFNANDHMKAKPNSIDSTRSKSLFRSNQSSFSQKAQSNSSFDNDDYRYPSRYQSFRQYILPDPYASEPVRETNQMTRDYDQQTGNKMINQYMVISELGRGCHGKVKLCIDTETAEKWAVKIVEKNSRKLFHRNLTSKQGSAGGANRNLHNQQLEKIQREVAILKKCSHPHIVRLREVIDDPHSHKIYLVLEFLEGGEIVWHDNSDPPNPTISVDTARSVFRDLVCGVQYLHYQGIVHRDIKPANLLWTGDCRVKISDFGVSVFVGRRGKRSKRGARRRYKTDPEAALPSLEGTNTEIEDGTGTSDAFDDDDEEIDSMETNELELAKTAGSPAFFAPELCAVGDIELTRASSTSSPSSAFNNLGSNVSSNTPTGSNFSSQLQTPAGPTAQNSFVAPNILSDNYLSLSKDHNSVSRTQSVSTSPGHHFVNDIDTQGPETILEHPKSEHTTLVPSIQLELPVDERQSGPSKGNSPKNESNVSLDPFEPPPGAPIDIWAMGITLFCFIYGQVPFIAETEFELFNVITKSPLIFPDDPIITNDLKHLLTRLLEKDPAKRITLKEIRLHPWVTADLLPSERETWIKETDPSYQYAGRLLVSQDDVRHAVTVVVRFIIIDCRLRVILTSTC